jgi:hypothetical protein
MGFRLQTLALAGAAGAISLSFNFAAWLAFRPFVIECPVASR